MRAAFSSSEVIELTGITARQLQWWDERGIVVPARRGRCRTYSLDDLAEVAVICDLRARGFSLQKVRAVMRFLQKELGKRLAQTLSNGSEYHLLTDGRQIFLESSARQVVNVLKNTRQPMLTICLSDTVRRIRAEIRGRTPLAPAARKQPAAVRKGSHGARQRRAQRAAS